jgi:hypothetical protein
MRLPTDFIFHGENKREAQDPKLGPPFQKNKKNSFVFYLNEISPETKRIFFIFSERG